MLVFGQLMKMAQLKSENKYGLVNKQGKEQVPIKVPIKYEYITRNKDGTYTVKENGAEFKIDKDGNRIP